MKPPEVVKTVGIPKVKRNRVLYEKGKRKGECSVSRKGATIHWSKCDKADHNARSCYNVQARGKEKTMDKYQFQLY